MRRSADPATPGRVLALHAGLPVLLLGGLFLALAPTPSVGPPAYPAHPLPAHTGGFGEPTCHTCHFDEDLNAPGGQLRIEGWPETLVPGRRYTLTVHLKRDGMEQAGFQLALRTAEGQQAGVLQPEDGRSSITRRDNGVQYLHHTLEGAALTGPGEATWRFSWQAPENARNVVAHVVANAANGDESAFGDAIYTDSLHARR